MMRYIFLGMLLSLFSVAGAQQVVYDKDAQLRKVDDFHSIHVSSAIDLRISQGDEDVVAVSAPSAENREGIRTEVRNGVLRIWYEQKRWYRSSGKVRVYVAARSLKQIEASGACDVTVTGELRTEELAIRLSGASDFKGAVRAETLSVDLSGASDVTLRGSAANINIETNGASHFKGFDLVVENCLIAASGASDIKITVNKVLNAKASGASKIRYQGEGVINGIETSGASSISRKG